MAEAQHNSEPGESLKRLKDEVEGLKDRLSSLRAELKGAQETIARLRRSAGGETQPAGAQHSTEVEGESAPVRRLQQKALILEHENTVARRLQGSLSPVWAADFESVQFATESRAGARVGGDFYDVIRLPNGCIGVLIADVTGYGLPAAVMMATARMAFRTFATLASSPKDILEKVNEALLESTLPGHHLTAFLGLLDGEMLTLQYVNASHCPPYLLRDRQVEPLDTEGLFVGMFDDPQYEQNTIQLERHDKLFLFTDGLISWFGAEQRDLALKNLREWLRVNSGLSVDELVQSIAARVGREPEDDVVIVAAELLRRRAREKTIVISSVPSEMRRVEDAILPALDAKGYGERHLFAVKLALEEAISNAIKHGNQLDSTKRVTIEFNLQDDRAVLSVEDEGEGFDPAAVPDPREEENLESFTGRGLILMRAYMDSVEFNQKANKVTMLKYAPWAGAKA